MRKRHAKKTAKRLFSDSDAFDCLAWSAVQKDKKMAWKVLTAHWRMVTVPIANFLKDLPKSCEATR